MIKLHASPQYAFAWWGTRPSSSCTEQTMPHSPLNDGTENNTWEMRRSHVGAYEQRHMAWKKFTHVSEARTASIFKREE